MSARLRAAGVPARMCPPRITRVMGAAPPALFLLGQQIVRVDLLEAYLALQLEVLGVEIARLLESGHLELADRHLSARDLLRVDEARPDLCGPQRSVRIHLRMMLDHVAHTFLEVLGAERPVRALERGAQERLERLGVLRDGFLAGHEG